MRLQAYKRETLGQEALLREKEEAILMERKRRYGMLHLSLRTGALDMQAQLLASSMTMACLRLVG